MCDVTVTSYVTTRPYFLINYSPHHLFCLEMCDVTTYVTPIVGSLSKEGVNRFLNANPAGPQERRGLQDRYARGWPASKQTR